MELFESALWAEPAAGPDVHRVRKGGIHSGKWLPQDQSRVLFYHIDDVLQMVRAEILGQSDPLVDRPEPHPQLRDGSRCRWKRTDPDPDLEILPNGVQTWAKSHPILAYSGEWMIFLAGGVGWVPCSEVTPLDHFGKPIPLPQSEGARP